MNSAAGVKLTRLALAISATLASPTMLAQEEQQPVTQQAPAGPIEEVIAVGRQSSAAMDVVAERLEQESVTDFIGTAQISRVGDGTVSLALRRVPGLTVVNDQFVYVRGLGERYSSVLLNGANVPSPDLTRNVIPLDIFPTEIIDAIAVQKGYSPDMPAAFGGGAVNIVTRGIPTGPVASFKISSGNNSESSQNGYTYSGGDDDRLGTDDGTRALPNELSTALNTYQGDLSTVNIYNRLSDDGNFHFFDEAVEVNRGLIASLNRDIGIREKSLGPDYGMEAALGNRWFPGEGQMWEFGALGLISYDNAWRNKERTERSAAEPDRFFKNTLRTTNQVSATTVLNMGLGFGNDHEISTSTLFLRNTDDESSIMTGHDSNFEAESGQRERRYGIRFEERELRSNQIRGSHTIGADTRELVGFLDNDFVEGVEFDWYFSDSEAETRIPNEVVISAEDRIDPTTGAFIETFIRRNLTAADYRFTSLTDNVESSGMDVMKPFRLENAEIKVSAGADAVRKSRDYRESRFGFGPAPTDASLLIGTPEEVFSDANIMDPAYNFELTNSIGFDTENYLAAQNIDAQYVKVDAYLDETWRIVGGLRYEQFRQVVLPFDPNQYDPGIGQVPVITADNIDEFVFTEDEVYPSVSLTYDGYDFWSETFQLRFGLSQTVTRPDLREVSSAIYIDPLTETRIQGNNRLVTADLTNLDARAEWLFDSGNNFIVSFFYKDIERPIEVFQGPASEDNILLTFRNAESAEILGLELEWLVNGSMLSDRWGRWADQFFYSGNITVSDSELTVGEIDLDVRNPVRPLAQHSDLITNMQLGFDSINARHSWSLAYNTFSERLFFAGRSLSAGDAYEQPFDSLDFIYSFYPTDKLSLKFQLKNLLDSSVEIDQGGVTRIEQEVGQTIKFDAKWNLGS